MSISPTKVTFKAGEKIFVKAVITNQSGKSLWLLFFPDISSFVIRIQDDKGKTPQETAHGCRMHMSAACNNEDAAQQAAKDTLDVAVGHAQSTMVPPGKEANFLIDISDEYVLDQPGAYTVDVTVSDFNLVNFSVGASPEVASRDVEKAGPVRSNTATIQIVQ